MERSRGAREPGSSFVADLNGYFDWFACVPQFADEARYRFFRFTLSRSKVGKLHTLFIPNQVGSLSDIKIEARHVG
jgi:hypothetical protein